MKLGLFSKRPRTGGMNVKRRYPGDYKSWLYWEMLLPLTAPAVIFVMLLFNFAAHHAEDPFAKALISISGSGDLLVLSALMLINIGAKLRILEVPRRAGRDFESGELDSNAPSFLALLMLSIYFVARVQMETDRFDDVYRFTYGFASVVVLLLVALWIDCIVCKMHTDLLKFRLSSGLVENQYNR